MGTGNDNTDYLLSLIREGKKDDAGAAVAIDRLPQCAGRYGPVVFHCDAVYRRFDGREPGGERIGLHRVGIDHDVAVLGTARPQQRGSPCRWRTGSGPATSQGPERCSGNPLRLHLYSVLCWRPSASPSAERFQAGWAATRPYGTIRPFTFGYFRFFAGPCN